MTAHAYAADQTQAGSRRANGDLLADATAMDAVTLYVADFEAMIGYYRDALALKLQHRSDKVAVLGRKATPIIVLRHEPDLPVPARSQAGLFHTAILFESEAALSAAVITAAQHKSSHFVGSADHLVSDAFYFTDPEGNGIELYWDKPVSAWPYRNGQIEMPSLFLDPNEYLQQHADEKLLDNAAGSPASVGHVHLQVGDTSVAKSFYVDTLGFEQTFATTGALFVSAGGYHHHMAMNVWNSAGAGPRAATLGLGEVAISVPGRSDLDALAERLRDHRVQVRDSGASLAFEDPWKNHIEVKAQG